MTKKKNWAPFFEFIYPALIFFGAIYSWYSYSPLESKEVKSIHPTVTLDQHSLSSTNLEDLP